MAQYPLKVKLQLFKTKKKGWGVRCTNDLPCGTFICVYNGNILTEKNANEVWHLFLDNSSHFERPLKLLPLEIE